MQLNLATDKIIVLKELALGIKVQLLLECTYESAGGGLKRRPLGVQTYMSKVRHLSQSRFLTCHTGKQHKSTQWVFFKFLKELNREKILQPALLAKWRMAKDF